MSRRYCNSAEKLSELVLSIDELMSAVDDLKQIRSLIFEADYMKMSKADLTGLLDGIGDVIDNGIGREDEDSE